MIDFSTMTPEEQAQWRLKDRFASILAAKGVYATAEDTLAMLVAKVNSIDACMVMGSAEFATTNVLANATNLKNNTGTVFSFTVPETLTLETARGGLVSVTRDRCKLVSFVRAMQGGTVSSTVTTWHTLMAQSFQDGMYGLIMRSAYNATAAVEAFAAATIRRENNHVIQTEEGKYEVRYSTEGDWFHNATAPIIFCTFLIK